MWATLDAIFLRMRNWTKAELIIISNNNQFIRSLTLRVEQRWETTNSISLYRDCLKITHNWIFLLILNEIRKKKKNHKRRQSKLMFFDFSYHNNNKLNSFLHTLFRAFYVVNRRTCQYLLFHASAYQYKNCQNWMVLTRNESVLFVICKWFLFFRLAIFPLFSVSLHC